jgi:hypothetical protein
MDIKVFAEGAARLWKTNEGQYKSKNNVMDVQEGIWFDETGSGGRRKVETAADGIVSLGPTRCLWRQSVYAPLDDADLLDKVLVARALEITEEKARWAARNAEAEAAEAERVRKVASGEILTLDVILKRDEEKIDQLTETLKLTQPRLAALEQTIEQEKKAATEDLRAKVAATEQFIDEKYAGERGALTTQIDQTTVAWNKATHLDELDEQIYDALLSEHHDSDCWPDSDCRSECSYQPDDSEIEEYLFENAENFQVEDKPNNKLAASA